MQKSKAKNFRENCPLQTFYGDSQKKTVLEVRQAFLEFFRV